MLYNKSNIIGLDVLVDKLQSKLYNKLLGLWGYDVLAYPRCYTNYTDGKKNIEHYISNNEYENVLFAEETKFFFVQEGEINPVDTEGFNTYVDLYFIIDLRDVNKSIERSDYDCLNDVVNVIKNCSSFEVNSIDTDFKSVFRETQFLEDTDDLQPFTSFKLSLLSERFELNKTKCNNGG